MGLLEARIIKDLLGNRRFGLVVDLGCGDGDLGKAIRANAEYLIGVDHNRFRLERAAGRNVYDELLLVDFREYLPPPETEAIFMLQIIEHIPKEDGAALLSKLSWIRTIVLTTPEKFQRLSLKNSHVSLWTEEDFRGLGFETILFSKPPLWEFIYGKGILAFKGL